MCYHKVSIMKEIVGVGPHPKPWPTDLKYDPELLKNGDTRNVVDKYRYWTLSAIKQDLEKTAAPLQVAIENFQYDFNIGTIVRNANAFNIRTIHIIGRKQWNKRGAMVTDKYLNIIYHKTTEDFAQAVDGYNIVAVDNTGSAIPVQNFTFLKDSILVFGAEGPGLSPQMQELAHHQVYIPQSGSTRSINVGVASGIIMFMAIQNITN